MKINKFTLSALMLLLICHFNSCSKSKHEDNSSKSTTLSATKVAELNVQKTNLEASLKLYREKLESIGVNFSGLASKESKSLNYYCTSDFYDWSEQYLKSSLDYSRLLDTLDKENREHTNEYTDLEVERLVLLGFLKNAKDKIKDCSNTKVTTKKVIPDAPYTPSFYLTDAQTKKFQSIINGDISPVDAVGFQKFQKLLKIDKYKQMFNGIVQKISKNNANTVINDALAEDLVSLLIAKQSLLKGVDSESLELLEARVEKNVMRMKDLVRSTIREVKVTSNPSISSYSPLSLKKDVEDYFVKNFSKPTSYKPISYQLSKDNVLDILDDGLMQCVSGTNFNILINLIYRGIKFINWHPVVIFKPGHVLPGFILDGKLFGVETTFAGLGEVYYGKVSELSNNKNNNFYLLDAIDYTILFNLGFLLTPSEKEQSLSAAVTNFSVKYLKENLDNNSMFTNASNATHRSPADFMFLPKQQLDKTIKARQVVTHVKAEELDSKGDTAKDESSENLLTEEHVSMTSSDAGLKRLESINSISMEIYNYESEKEKKYEEYQDSLEEKNSQDGGGLTPAYNKESEFKKYSPMRSQKNLKFEYYEVIDLPGTHFYSGSNVFCPRENTFFVLVFDFNNNLLFTANTLKYFFDYNNPLIFIEHSTFGYKKDILKKKKTIVREKVIDSYMLEFKNDQYLKNEDQLTWNKQTRKEFLRSLSTTVLENDSSTKDSIHFISGNNCEIMTEKISTDTREQKENLTQRFNEKYSDKVPGLIEKFENEMEVINNQAKIDQ